jgi:hypothetical protein
MIRFFLGSTFMALVLALSITWVLFFGIVIGAMQ